MEVLSMVITYSLMLLSQRTPISKRLNQPVLQWLIDFPTFGDGQILNIIHFLKSHAMKTTY